MGFRYSHRNNLLYPIDGMTQQFAHVLFCINKYYIAVNNFEISKWEHDYLSIWINAQDQPYITSERLFAYLQINYVDIFQLYFMIYGIIPTLLIYL